MTHSFLSWRQATVACLLLAALSGHIAHGFGQPPSAEQTADSADASPAEEGATSPSTVQNAEQRYADRADRFLFAEDHGRDRYRDQTFADVHTAGIHRGALKSRPQLLQEIDAIADAAREQRHAFALREDHRTAFDPDCRWVIQLVKVRQVEDRLICDVAASIGQQAELSYSGDNAINRVCTLHETWRLSDQAPVLISRRMLTSQKQSAAPYDPLPRTRRQLQQAITNARGKAAPPGGRETPLERLQRRCAGYLNQDLTVVPLGYTPDADVDERLRQDVIREAIANWQRQLEALKTCRITIRREQTQWIGDAANRSTIHYEILHDLTHHNSLVRRRAETDIVVVHNRNYWFSLVKGSGKGTQDTLTDARRVAPEQRYLFGRARTPALESMMCFGLELPDLLNKPEQYLWAVCRRTSDGLIEVAIQVDPTDGGVLMTMLIDPRRTWSVVECRLERRIGLQADDEGFLVRNVVDESGRLLARLFRTERIGPTQRLLVDSYTMEPLDPDPTIFRLAAYGYPEWPALWEDGTPPDDLQPEDMTTTSPLAGGVRARVTP